MAIRIMASSITPNLFSSLPPRPSSQNTSPPPPPPPLPLPLKKSRIPNSQTTPPPQSKSLKKSFHYRTNYRKPLPSHPAVLSSSSAADDRAVVLSPSGISYLLPGAPFHFQFSYSETPKAAPLAIREPAFLPFAPPDMPRPWTGKAPLISKRDKERKKKIRLFEPVGLGEERMVRIAERRVEEMVERSGGDGRSREEVLGEPLTRSEVRDLVRPWLSKNRQVNLGKAHLSHFSLIC